MTDSALVVGGTRFIGRHLVEELLEHGYEVTLFNRGTRENPFADREGVARVEGDRADRAALERAREAADPGFVFDTVAYHPEDVRTATEVFAGADAYVYVSSGAAYGDEEIPKREGETRLCDCTPEQAEDDSMETYGPRKAEGDRAVFEAARGRSRTGNASGVSTTAAEGVRAMAVRPCIVYGPHDYTERMDFWLDRVATHDRVLVPGDGTNLWHRVYVEDVASALRVVAEEGEAGAAYNVGDRRLATLEETVELIADAMGVEVEVVTAGEHELATAGLGPEDYPFYRPYPHVLDTAELAALGWESTPLGEAMARTVEEHRESDRDGAESGPDRETEERVLGVLDTM